MSSAPVPPSTPSRPLSEPAPPGDTGARATDKIVVYRHSHLFYWWPVWALGFLFAAITYFDNKHLAIVPANTTAEESIEVIVDGKKEVRHVLILGKAEKGHWSHKDDKGNEEIVQPTIFITHYKTVGS